MAFGFAQQVEYEAECDLLKAREKRAKTVSGTLKPHAFKPVSGCTLEFREYSSSDVSRIESASVDVTSVPNANLKLAGYVTVKYDGKWWLAHIAETLMDSQEVNVNFLLAAGPSNSFYFPEILETCLLHRSDPLISVEPRTATGRTYTLTRRERNDSDKALNVSNA